MIPVSNEIFKKLKDLYEQEEAMMAGQWPDGDYSEQFKEICLENYGVSHPLKNEEVFNNWIKKSYSKKEYTLPSGKIILVQGEMEL